MSLERIAVTWLKARDVIKGLLHEIAPHLTQEQLDHNAAAVIARLAGQNPSILLQSSDDDAPEDEP